MKERSLPLPKACFTIGESGHHIRYHNRNKPIGGDDEVWGAVVGFDGDVIVVDLPDGEQVRLRHHDMDRLKLAIEWFGTKVAVRDGLLAVPHDVEIRPGEWVVAHYMFGTAPDVGNPLGECLAEDDPRVNPIFRGKGAT